MYCRSIIRMGMFEGKKFKMAPDSASKAERTKIRYQTEKNITLSASAIYATAATKTTTKKTTTTEWQSDRWGTYASTTLPNLSTLFTR